MLLLLILHLDQWLRPSHSTKLNISAEMISASIHVTHKLAVLLSGHELSRCVWFAGQEAEVEGTLSVQPQANPVKGFEEYFLNLTVENNKRNPWFGGE